MSNSINVTTELLISCTKYNIGSEGMAMNIKIISGAILHAGLR